MSSVLAGQHIFGNADKERSPTGFWGFQTLFYSKDFLSKAESDQIEKHVGYFPSDENPEKLVFFRIGEKFVITQIIPLEDTDKSGRKGAYIAHSFVFSKKDFEQFQCNPFAIFELFPEKFVRTLDDGLALGKKGDLNIAPAEFTLNQEKIMSLEIAMNNPQKQWDILEIKKMVYCAINADLLRADSKSFKIFGDQNEIRNTLKIIFSLIPTKARSFCTFDTYFSGCNPVTVNFWAYCYPNTPMSSSLGILANADTKRVSNINLKVTTPYEKWVFEIESSKDTQGLYVFKDTVFELDQYLSNKMYDRDAILKSLTMPGIEMFLESNQSLLQSKMQEHFSNLVSDILVKYLTKFITKKFDSNPKTIILEKILIGFDQDEIARCLFKELKEDTTPNMQKIIALDTYLSKNQNQLLRILSCKWARKNDAIPKLLQTLTDEDYKTAVILLIDDLDLKTILINSKTSLFSEIFISEMGRRRISGERVLELVALFFDRGLEDHLVKITTTIPKLNRKQMVAIQDYCAKQKAEKRAKIPKEFTKALKENIEKTNDERGLFNLDKFVSKLPFFTKK